MEQGRKTGSVYGSLVIEFIAAACAVLFFYAATSKLLDYELSRRQMLNQVFPVVVAKILVWAVPVAELIIAGLLLYKPTRLKGFYAFTGLMLAFTLYIAVAMSGVFGRTPCSCGGILRHMGYWIHLVFNLFFVGVAIVGIVLDTKRRRLFKHHVISTLGETS
ncbi:putative membrane protein YphA (DoxX/SURF4 family) [Pedobacter sp. AK017]|uniref:MauE/DoxX family redox-associated membrane protein n=1 Tax=Pedobacter sp. AK017 TaxID=2723073 RepID=UPI00161A2530|nr:MauE/DoxX family redox-associated membrane protein [Pedobacter sp. AK017]MBB5441254.1 putative membrane protein YphA (DoxX/SURF4 family) [Pedobacter sp. AK017]